jgi:hypothetical protein
MKPQFGHRQHQAPPDTGYLVGVKHALNRRFNEEDGDVPHDFRDNEVATEFFNPRRIPLISLNLWVAVGFRYSSAFVASSDSASQ